MASNDQIDKIINIRFNGSELVEGIRVTQNTIKELNEDVKVSEKNFQTAQAEVLRLTDRLKTFKKGTQAYIKTQKELHEAQDKLTQANVELIDAHERQIIQTKTLSDAQRQYQKELQNNIKIQTATDGSLEQMRARLSNLRAEYQKASEAGRAQLAPQINDLKDKIKEADYAIQEYNSNVGNYEKAILNALGVNGRFANTLLHAAKGGKTFNEIIITASRSVMGLVKSAMAFIATPIGVVLAAIAIAIKFAKDEFDNYNQTIKHSEKFSNEYKESTALAQSATDALTRSIERQTKKAMGWLTTWENIKATLKLIFHELRSVIFGQKSMSEAMVSIYESFALKGYYEELSKDENAYLEQRRKNIVEEARLEAEIQEQREIATNKEQYNLQQRKAAIEEAKKLEKEKYDLQKKDLETQKELLKRRHIDPTESSSEELDEVARLEASIKRLDAQYERSIRALNQQKNRLNSEGNSGIKKISNEIEDVEKRIKASSERIYRLTLDAMEKTRQAELERIDKEEKHELETLETRVEANRKAQEDNRKNGIVINQELNDKLISEAEIYEKERIGITEAAARERAQINEKWDKKALDEAIKEREKALRLEMRKQSAIRAKEKAQDETREIKFATQNPYDEIGQLQQRQISLNNELIRSQNELARITSEDYEAMGLSADEHAARVAGAARNVALAQYDVAENEKAIMNATLAAAEATLSGLSGVAGAFGQLAEAFGADKGVVKGMAIAQGALGMAAAIAQAAMTPFPFNLAAIAGVIGQFASIISTIRSLNQESDEQFARGGLIPVSGNAGVIQGPSHAGGGVPLHVGGRKVGEVEGGELLAIVNKKDTAQLQALSRLNSGHGVRFENGGLVDWSGIYRSMNIATGYAIQTPNLDLSGTDRAIVQAIRAGFKDATAVVSVRDIVTEQKRVQVSSGYASYSRRTRRAKSE